MNDRYNAQQQLPFLQLVTWNDYEEGSALEPGIASCTTIKTQRNGGTLAVAVTHPETVDHLEFYQRGQSRIVQVDRAISGRYDDAHAS